MLDSTKLPYTSLQESLSASLLSARDLGNDMVMLEASAAEALLALLQIDRSKPNIPEIEQVCNEAKAGGCIYAYGAGSSTRALKYDDVLELCRQVRAANTHAFNRKPTEQSFDRADALLKADALRKVCVMPAVCRPGTPSCVNCEEADRLQQPTQQAEGRIEKDPAEVFALVYTAVIEAMHRCGFNKDALTETNAKTITHSVRDALYGRAIA